MTIDKHTARQLAKTYRSFFDSDNEAGAYAGVSGHTIRNAMSAARTKRSTVAAIDDALTAISRHNEYRPDAAFTTQQKKELLDELLANFDTLEEASLFCGFSKNTVNKWNNGRNGMNSKSADKVHDAVQRLRRQKTTDQNDQTQDIEERANKKPLPQAMKIPPPPKREQEADEAYTKRVDWSRWVYSDGEVRGISLRAMVEDGLYGHLRGAVSALKRGDFSFAEVTAEPAGPQGGRPATDYILPLEHAQLFAAEANTPAGSEFRRLLILKANEFHRLIDGETGAHYRMGAEQARRGNHKESAKAYGSGIEDTLRQLQLEQKNHAEQIQLVAAASDAAIGRLAETTLANSNDVGVLRQELRELKAGIGSAVFGDLSARDKRGEIGSIVSDIARHFADDDGDLDYRGAWNKLYSDVGRQLGCRVTARAEQEDLKPIAWLEKHDLLELTYSVAVGLLQRYQGAH